MELKTTLKILFALGFLFTLQACYEEFPLVPQMVSSNSILIDGKELAIDPEAGFALFPIREQGSLNERIHFADSSTVCVDGQAISSGDKFNFGEINASSSFIVECVTGNNENLHYELKFTLLPVIQIWYDSPEILDEPKIPAIFMLTDPSLDTTLTVNCAIEIRGGSSQAFPKKSFGFELRHDWETTRGRDLSLAGMPKRAKWILDAAYNDRSLTRNRVSFDIWRDMQAHAARFRRNTLPSATEGRFVEVFLNGSYWGVYCLSEPVDEKLLGFETDNNESVLYKSINWSGATMLNSISDTAKSVKTWEGWEQILPNPDTKSYWKPLYSYVDLVVSANNDEFNNRIQSEVELDQSMDFFILMNLIQGSDNAGKNLFMAKKQSSDPLSILPWDMDAAWGRDWQAEKQSAEGFCSFGLFERLFETNTNNYKYELGRRYFQLRDSVLNSDRLCNLFSNYNSLLSESGALEREQIRWPKSIPNPEAELIYLKQWIPNRLSVLDEYFNNLMNE